MPSDPSFGTTGFFSYLWTPRRPVSDGRRMTPVLVSDDGLWVLTDDDADGHFDDRRLTGGAFDSDYFILVDDNATVIGNLLRWI